MIEARIQIGLVGRGFLVTWTALDGSKHESYASNRTALMRCVGIEAAPMARGDLPVIDEVIDIHEPRRRAGDG